RSGARNLCIPTLLVVICTRPVLFGHPVSRPRVGLDCTKTKSASCLLGRNSFSHNIGSVHGLGSDLWYEAARCGIFVHTNQNMPASYERADGTEYGPSSVSQGSAVNHGLGGPNDGAIHRPDI